MVNNNTVELFIPCFIDQLYPQTAFNTIKVLEKAGCKVIYNPEQTCCGQPAYNAKQEKNKRHADNGHHVGRFSASCCCFA